jgi:hypothetical protein
VPGLLLFQRFQIPTFWYSSRLAVSARRKLARSLPQRDIHTVVSMQWGGIKMVCHSTWIERAGFNTFLCRMRTRLEYATHYRDRQSTAGAGYGFPN